uniref:PITH domain-containing protein n=1 Tax=Strongyloides venezuelensis TaxID=75913 RepID=A0A0K0FWH1_STRVS
MSISHDPAALKLFSDDNIVNQDISHGSEENLRPRR